MFCWLNQIRLNPVRNHIFECAAVCTCSTQWCRLCGFTSDQEPGGKEVVGSLPEEADCGESSGFTSTEGKTLTVVQHTPHEVRDVVWCHVVLSPSHYRSTDWHKDLLFLQDFFSFSYLNYSPPINCFWRA